MSREIRVDEIEIRNTFHRTYAVVRPRGGRVSVRATRRALDALCGMTDCGCWHLELPEGWDLVEDRDGAPVIKEVV